MLLRLPGQPGHRQYFLVGQARHGLPLRLDRHRGDGIVAGQPVLDGLGRDGAFGYHADHFVHQEVVRGDLPADHGLAEAPRRVDGDLRPVAVERVEGERHPRRPRPHHLLHADAHRGIDAAVTPFQPVDDAAVGEQAGPAAEHVPDHRVGAAYPQVGVVFAGEARVGLVLDGRRGADGDRNVALIAPPGQLGIGGADRVGQAGRQLKRADQLPRPRSGRRHRRWVVRVGRGDQRVELAADPTVGQRLAVRLGRDGEAGRHRQAGPG